MQRAASVGKLARSMFRPHCASMTHRTAVSAFVACTLLAVASAQNEEAEFNQRQAKALNSFAKKAFDKGFPRIAKVVWLQVHKLYDADNAEAWTALGYVKIGAGWNPDPKKPYPTTDTGSGAEGQPLQRQYEALKKDLANQHRGQAERAAKAGRTDLALHHWRMVLRWVDNDAQAQKALEHREVGGVTGTALEQTLFDRSKMMEKVVEEQSRVTYEVKKVDSGVECPVLDKAQVKYITVRSEHFTLHGDAAEEENLLKALEWAERAMRVCEAAFPWQVPKEWWSQSDMASFTAKETYQQILRANNVENLEWKLEHTGGSTIGNTRVGINSGPQVLFDSCVRRVAQIHAGFRADAFSEGIGHTFVGMVFNNNRLHGIDLEKQQGTAASEEDREYQSPDFDVWKNLNLELAWRSTGGVPAKELPFCETAKFTNEQRIKAWSFCDYMMRRDPEMLRGMDQMAVELASKRIKQPTEFEKLFAEKHPDVSVAQLDKEWEDFWTGASPVLKAIQNNTPPLQAISKGVDKWLEAFNAARKEWGATPVLWSATLSTRCKEHAEYLKANKDQRGPALQHRQQVDLGGTYLGSKFAEMAIVETKVNLSSAKKMFESWVNLPGYRDALINNYVLSIGLYVDGDILVMNTVSGLGEPKAANVGWNYFPRKNDTVLDAEVSVDDLGPDVVALLEKHGKTGVKKIGQPITLHFGGTSGLGNRASYVCTVTTGKGEKIDGAILFPDGPHRTSAAPGVVAFIPFAPLPKGQIVYAWSFGDSDRQQSAKGQFTAR